MQVPEMGKVYSCTVGQIYWGLKIHKVKEQLRVTKRTMESITGGGETKRKLKILGCCSELRKREQFGNSVFFGSNFVDRYLELLGFGSLEKDGNTIQIMYFSGIGLTLVKN